MGSASSLPGAGQICPLPAFVSSFSPPLPAQARGGGAGFKPLQKWGEKATLCHVKASHSFVSPAGGRSAQALGDRGAPGTHLQTCPSWRGAQSCAKGRGEARGWPQLPGSDLFLAASAQERERERERPAELARARQMQAAHVCGMEAGEGAEGGEGRGVGLGVVCAFTSSLLAPPGTSPGTFRANSPFWKRRGKTPPLPARAPRESEAKRLSPAQWRS